MNMTSSDFKSIHNEQQQERQQPSPNNQQQSPISVETQQQVASTPAIGEYLLGEIKEININSSSNTKNAPNYTKQRDRALGKKRRASHLGTSSTDIGAQYVNNTVHEKLQSESLKNDSNHSHPFVNPSKKGAVKSTGKKVLNVASLPFRKVKKKFTTQTSNGSDKGRIKDANILTSAAANELRISIPNNLPSSAGLERSTHGMSEFVSRAMSPVASLLSRRTLRETASLNSHATTSSGIDHDVPTKPVGNTTDDIQGMDLTDTVVKQIESLLRMVCGLFLAYYLGVRYPEYQAFVRKAWEYTVVAWVTCVSIRVMTMLRQYQNRSQQKEQRLSSQTQYEFQHVQLPRHEICTDDEVTDDFFEAAVESTDQLQADDSQLYPTVEHDEDAWLPSTDEDLQELSSPKSLPNSPANSSLAGIQQDVPRIIESDNIQKSTLVDGQVMQNEQTMEPRTESSNSMKNHLLQQSQSLVHPSLQPLYMIDTTSSTRIYPNTFIPCPIETDVFKGEMLLLIRTPNVDNIERENPAGVDTDENAAVVDFFRGKLRRFEIQIQVKLKRVPTGRVYFACELQEPVKMGMIQRAFVGAALSFVRTKNKCFHYSLSGSAPETGYDNRYEAPHMAFPIEESMDRLVITPHGQTPPRLGREIYEDPEAMRRRKKTLQIDYNTTDTYTFSVWSAYADFLDWCCLNLPGIRPFSISSIIGSQPILITLYEIPENDSVTGRPLDKHYRSEMISIANFEMCNAVHTPIGPATKKWKALNHKGKEKQQRDKLKKENSESSMKVNLQKLQADILSMDDEEADDFDGSMPINNLHDEFSVRNTTENPSDHAAEELGEGIYLRSGDSISLREWIHSVNTAGNASTNDMNSFVDEPDFSSGNRSANFDQSISSCFKADIVHGCITQARGFAVLQETVTPHAITIEKAGKSAKNKSKLIKSGDTVVFKMAGRYLSVHRGWWLKWVASSSTKNSCFTIHKNEEDFTDRNEGLSEIQSSYLALGNSFFLKHKRWSKYYVGVSAEESISYGGRMLGLHIPPRYGGSKLGDFPNNFDEGDHEPDNPIEDKGGTKKTQWMKSLLLSAYELPSTNPTTPGFLIADKKVTKNNSFSDDNNNNFDRDKGSTPKFIFAHDHFQVDVPAWLEVLNRTERIRQHTYAVRVVPPSYFETLERGNSMPSTEEKNATVDDASFIRLRTGRDLAQVMRAGVKWRNSVASPRKAKPRDNIAPGASRGRASRPGQFSDAPTEGLLRSRSLSAPNVAELAEVCSVHSFSAIETLIKSQEFGYQDEFLNVIETPGKEDEASESESDIESSDDSELAENLNESRAEIRKRRKGRKLLGKVAKVVKTTAASTGRTVVRTTTTTGKNVVLGTVYVGKSILPIRSKNIPLKEPKSVGRRHYIKQRGKDLSVDIRSRSMRRIELLEAESTGMLAGILSAPEESRRTVSKMLSKMAAEQASSSIEKGFSSLLSALVSSASQHDNDFLKGSALQLGVAPCKMDASNKGLMLIDFVVARCLWESHWREEWCALHEFVLSFYAPLTSTPCMELSLIDIQSVRLLDPGEMCPLPGYPLLALETAWICHYCAFRNEDARSAFYRKVEGARKHIAESNDPVEMSREKELKEAHFWQGFSNSLDFSRTHGNGKWENVQSGAKMKGRVVLNNRRMVFDLAQIVVDINRFVEEMLATALSFSLSSLQKHPEALISFLDSASQLRSLPLHTVDRSSKEAYCLFVNIYHCLLQHALLFSVNGALHKRSCLHFMRTSCYEIGGEIFSLAELHSCVIRGNMSRAVSPKPPYVDVSKKSNAYRFYALGYVSPKTNFLLNTANASCPSCVPVLNPVEMEDQLNNQLSIFLRKSVVVDTTRKLILLPKVFEIYRHDFASEERGFAIACVQFSTPYLPNETASVIRSLRLEDFIIKFHPPSEQFHSSLQPIA